MPLLQNAIALAAIEKRLQEVNAEIQAALHAPLASHSQESLARLAELVALRPSYENALRARPRAFRPF
jgi:hypothetical protein